MSKVFDTIEFSTRLKQRLLIEFKKQDRSCSIM